MTGVMVHPSGLCESQKVGEGTRIWAFAHVLPGAVVGADCNICDHTFIENDVVIGDRVTIKCGVQLWDGIRLEDDVFVGPNATFTNDRFPRSKQYPERFLTTTVCRGASIGANATILPGVTVGQSAMVGAGAVVTRNVPPHSIVAGNPARIIGYVNSRRSALSGLQSTDAGGASATQPTSVRGATIHRLKQVSDLRGNLAVGEFSKDVPFVPKRVFMVFDVPSADVRGEHAHRQCHQFLVCVKGACSVVVDDGRNREEVRLGAPNVGVHLEPMTWGVQYRYTPDAVLVVFASEFYDAADYIRDYDEFLAAVAR